MRPAGSAPDGVPLGDALEDDGSLAEGLGDTLVGTGGADSMGEDVPTGAVDSVAGAMAGCDEAPDPRSDGNAVPVVDGFAVVLHPATTRAAPRRSATTNR